MNVRVVLVNIIFVLVTGCTLDAKLIEPSTLNMPSLPSASRLAYKKAAKLSDKFVTIFNSTVKLCNTNSIATCTTLPDYVDGSSNTASISDAKLLDNDDVIAAGTISGTDADSAILLYWKSSSGMWSQLDQFGFDSSSNSNGIAIDISPAGSVAYQISGHDALGKKHFAVREWTVGSPVWSTVDDFTIGKSVGDGYGLAYGEDESLYSVGTLYNGSLVGTGCLRERKGPQGAWGTLDNQYISGGAETVYQNIVVLADKVVIVGWVGGGTRQLIIRDCSRSTGVCTTRKKMSLMSGDTYLSSVNWASGTSIYATGRVDTPSTYFILIKYDYGSDTLTTIETYQPAAGLPGVGIQVGFDSTGKTWVSGSRYSVDFFIHTYDSSDNVANTYLYP